MPLDMACVVVGCVGCVLEWWCGLYLSPLLVVALARFSFMSFDMVCCVGVDVSVVASWCGVCEVCGVICGCVVVLESVADVLASAQHG